MGKIGVHIVLKHRIAFTQVLFLNITLALFLILFFGNSERTHGAVTGDIRSCTSGNWNSLPTWQKYNGAAWVAATVIPSYTDKQINIQNGHTVSVTAVLTVDEVVVDSGGILILKSGVTMTLKKAAIPDLKVYGIFRNAGIVPITSGTNITYYDGSFYQHFYTTTAGTIPVGVWNTGSVCEIMGYTTNISIPSGLNQTFYELRWNCPSQVADVNFSGGLTSFTGNFSVVSTGTKELQLSNNNFTLTMTGNIDVSGGVLNFNTALNKSATLNQTGIFSVTGGTVNFTTGNSSTGTINLTGDYLQTAGTFNFSQGTSATTTLNVFGDFTHIGGTMITGGTSVTGQVVFKNTGTQSFVAYGNTVTGNVDYTVNSGATLNMQTYAMLGRNFTLSSGGELGIGSPDGITASGLSGNIQVSGTRTFNSGGYYLYNGVTFQYTGSGLPSSINKLTINNGSYLTLTNNVSVTNILNLTSGKIVTETNELIVTNTSAASITGNLTSSFIVGNLRRTITGSGTFAFPLGSLFLYEPMSVTLTGTTGFTSLLGTFVAAQTNDTTYPMTAIVNGVDLTEMLDYGYWTLAPNSSLTGGTYSVQINEKGFSNILSNGTFLSLLVRNNTTSSWQSAGTHTDNTQSVSGGVVTAVRSGLNSFYQYGIGLGDFLSFSSPSLISGTAGNVGAIYLFPDVMRNIDAWMEIMNLYNGATLSDIDNSATGYNDSFQPFVSFPPEKDSYIEWKIRFKIAGTSTDTTLNKIVATGVDVDGSYNDANNYIREYIVATMPTSYSLDPATSLTMSNDSGHYKALGPTSSVANIDTAHHEIMYQLNYNNVNMLMYRTGANNAYSTTQTRQTSLFFRSFLFGAPVYALPIELVEFKAKLKNGKVILNWTTASETNNDFFTVERSADGENFRPLFTKKGAGSSNKNRYYEMIDEYPLEGQSYYSLKQTDFDGKFSYSKIESVNNNKTPNEAMSIQLMSANPFDSELEIEFTIKSKSNVEISLMNSEGKIVEKELIMANSGSNRYRFEKNQNLVKGTYFVIIDQDIQRTTKRVIRN